MDLYALIIIQAIVVFLFYLNNSLLGASKDRISIILSWTGIILQVLVFLLYGFSVGIAFLIGTLLWAFISTPIAKYFGFRILGFRAPPQDYLLSHDLAGLRDGTMSLEKFTGKHGKTSEQWDKKILHAFRKEEIQTLLVEYGKTPEDLRVYNDILLPDLFPEIVTSPRKLRMLLELEKQGHSQTAISFEMRRTW